MGREGERVGWEGERVGIDRSGVGGGESGDRQEWRGVREWGWTGVEGGERVGIDRKSGIGRREWG